MKSYFFVEILVYESPALGVWKILIFLWMLYSVHGVKYIIGQASNALNDSFFFC